MSRRIFGLEEDNLRRLYLDERMSTIQIAKFLNCNDETVRERLIKYGIPLRSRHEAGVNKVMTPEHIAKLTAHVSKLNKGKFGENHPGWRGGRWLDSDGYVIRRIGRKNVKEHRYVVEQQFGIKLHRSEHVHHIDGDKQNNDISNLVVLGASEHLLHEWESLERRQMMSEKMKKIRAEHKHWGTRKKK